MHVELIDPATASDDDVGAWRECAVACALELHPREPVPPLDYLADLARNPGTHRPRRYFLAWDDSRTRVLGSGETHWNDGAESYRLQGYVEVHPAARRRGVGRALVAAISDAATSAGRTAVLGDAPYATDGIDFARALGAKFGLDEIRSVYRFESPSPAPQPVEGMSVVRWVDECPEEHVSSFADLRGVMNSAPQGGEVVYPDDIWDADRIRRIEATRREQNVRLYEVVARDDATSRLVGFTEVAVFDTWPEFGDQWDTGVIPDYRGRGVAKWVKTEMLAWLRTTEPALELLTTWNAAVNDSMLAVNKGLGYGDRERWIEAELELG
ncbi:MAG: GNAT family N-acetyltransferase [Actinomycetes bacterium]